MVLTDTIVFTQSELDKAIDSGCKSIALCDNNFILPSIPNMHYIGIGRITASIDYDIPKNYGVICTNFTPKTKRRHKIVNIKNKSVGIASIKNSDNKNNSYISSYKMGSYSSSYRLSSSYRASFSTSFVTSYKYEYRLKTSFAGSYTSSYRLGSSFSFITSFRFMSFIRSFKRKMYDYILTEISVNGYGIHLI